MVLLRARAPPFRVLYCSQLPVSMARLHPATAVGNCERIALARSFARARELTRTMHQRARAHAARCIVDEKAERLVEFVVLTSRSLLRSAMPNECDLHNFRY